MKQLIKKIIRKTEYSICKKKYNNSVNLFWFKKILNFGDILNPYLAEKLIKKEINWIDPKYYEKENYLLIGSILSDTNQNSIVWGSGFISENSFCKEVPKKVLAVRGPKSREKLLEQGISCPEVYGDPALLLPKFYNPKNILKKYEIGIIPHYVDKNHVFLSKMKNNMKKINIIDIQNNNVENFIDEVLKCKLIISSSLHGIIVADAYNIPSYWIRFSEDIVGGNFKFLDYFESVKRNDKNPILINESTNIEELEKYFNKYKIDIDLNKLFISNPWIAI